MSNILQELEQQITNATASVEKSNVGRVRETGDGVAGHNLAQRGAVARPVAAAALRRGERSLCAEHGGWGLPV